MNNTYYVTTPIYYVNDVPHIGHAYTTIIADTLNAYHQLKGKKTFFLTGTDEHGQKIEEAAAKRNRQPQEYANEISGHFRQLWDAFDIRYDRFIRTTDEAHKKGVQKAFQTMLNKGDIYKGEYEGHYCVSCETFFTETQLVDGEGCPECGKPTQVIKEESYFFRLSNYEKPLLDWIDQNPNAILPKSRRNEVIRFIEQGLQDLSITRTSFTWGVKLPESIGDEQHVVYVWLDALMNYVTALGYGDDEKDINFWPANTHLIGKDILRFHAIFWPAFLMSLELPLPRCIAAHGWWTRDGEKMSKSKGNVINPKEVADAYGLEQFRYFMLREVPFGQDGDFAQRALIDRINNDLNNDLGNLLNRLSGMAGKYFKSEISSENILEYFGDEMQRVDALIQGTDTYMQSMQLNRYLEEIWKIISIGNKTIEVVQPWAKMKTGHEDEVSGLLGLIANLLAKSALLLAPIMPKTAQTIANALQFTVSTESWREYIEENALLEDFTMEKIAQLFTKVDAPLMPTAEEQKSNPETPQSTQENTFTPKKKSTLELENVITIDQFFETTLKVGKVVNAMIVPKSDKLLLLQVDIGEESPRQVVAGIRQFYAPEDLMDTYVCLVANLKPAKLMGYASEGMVLAAKDESGLCLIRPERPVSIGTKIS